MKLHNYFRSSASYRVRIALELKALSYEYIAVHIAKGVLGITIRPARSRVSFVVILEIESGIPHLSNPFSRYHVRWSNPSGSVASTVAGHNERAASVARSGPFVTYLSGAERGT